MVNEKNLLQTDKIMITPDIYIKIPTVREILENEILYYNITYAFTATPFQCMVQLDDIGIDYTTIDEWQLFIENFLSYSHSITELNKTILMIKHQMEKITEKKILSKKEQELNQYKQLLDNFNISLNYIFDNLQIEGFQLCYDKESNEEVLLNCTTGVRIDKKTYLIIAEFIRKINLYKHVKYKPANENAKKYLIEKERRKLKRNKNHNEPYLEKMIISLVNTSEFPYNYKDCMYLSIYQFNQSLKQIQHKIDFDNTMIGVYAGTISVKDMENKDSLSWINMEQN